MTPVYKKRDKSDLGNYKPVPLTSVPCKMMVAIIRDYTIQLLQNSGWNFEHQHGFMKGGGHR